MIIGITGPLSAGKDTIADYLVEKKGFHTLGLGDIVREYVHKAGLESNRDTQREMGNKLRNEFGADFLIKEAIRRIPGENKVIPGVRQPIEADYFLSGNDRFLIATDAPVEERFKRMRERAREGDPETLEEFKDREAKEMNNTSNDPNVQNISYCMKKAHFFVDNSVSKDILYKNIDKVLKEINEKIKKI